MTNEKLEKRIARTLVLLVDSMGDTLREIKTSNRSRWVMLLVQLLIVIGAGIGAWLILDKISCLTNRMIMSQSSMLVHNARLDKLIRLAEQNATTPEIRQELQAIQELDEPTPENVIKAAAHLAPQVLLNEAHKLEKEYRKQGIGGGTNGASDHP